MAGWRGTGGSLGSWRPLRSLAVVLGLVMLTASCAQERTTEVRSGAEAPETALPAGRFVADDRVVDVASGRMTPLRYQAAAPLQGQLAVVSPDGSKLLYSTFEKAPADADAPGSVLGRPAIRLVELNDSNGSADRLVADGAVSPAWGPSGQIAYVKGVDPDLRQNEPYLGHVVVADRLGSPAAQWSAGEPAPYDVVGWAADTLLVARRSADGLAADIWAFTGPGEQRLLGSREGVLAIGPDGDQVLLVHQETGGARVVSLREGWSRTVDLNLDRFGGGRVEGFQSGASWVGTRLVATASIDGSPAFVVLDMAGLRVAALVRLDASRFPSAHDPYFFAGGRAVAAWAPNGIISPKPGEQLPARPFVLVWCALTDGSCRSRSLPGQRAVARVRVTARGPEIVVEEAAA